MQDLYFPNDIKTNKEYPSKIRFRIWDQTSLEGDPTTTIVLPVPVALSNNYGVNFDDIEVGLLGRIFQKTGAEVVNQFAEGKTSITTVGTQAALDLMTNSVAGAGALFLDSDAGKFVRGKLGASVNRAGQLTVNKPNNRTFSFRFEMVPQNEKEAQMIESIIQVLKVAMHPPTDAGTEASLGGAAGFFYFNPAKFQIDFLFSGDELNKKLFRTWYCFLTSMEVNYHNAGAPAYMPGGYQANKSISLNFTEISPLSRGALKSAEFGTDGELLNMTSNFGDSRTISDVAYEALGTVAAQGNAFGNVVLDAAGGNE